MGKATKHCGQGFGGLEEFGGVDVLRGWVNCDIDE
jgi:hypothetical protein